MTRRIASFCLTLLLSFTLAAGALAQGMAADAARHADLQEAVICIDGHETVVLIDRDGQPVEHDAPCPEYGCADCPRLPAALLAPAAHTALRAPVLKIRATAAHAQVALAVTQPLHLARAPPEKV
jgi:hypothetical protein